MEGRCRILLMRPTRDYGGLDRIGEVVWVPVIKLEPRKGCSLEALRRLKDHGIAVITSPRTLDILIGDAEEHSVRDELLEALRNAILAVIGPKTAESLKSQGLEPAIIPETYDSRHLGSEVARRAGGERVLILRSAQGVRELNEELSKAGVPYTEVPVYDVKVDQRAAEEAARLIVEGSVDYAVFTSPSMARAVCESLGKARPKATLVAIGETTRKALELHCGVSEILVPETYTLEGVAGLLAEKCRQHDNYDYHNCPPRT